MGLGACKLAFATCNESSRAWTLPQSPFSECEMTSSQYSKKTGDKDKKLSGVRGVGGNSASAGDSSR